MKARRCGCTMDGPCPEHAKLYAEFTPLRVRRQLQIGDRIRIIGNHPHAGECGRIEGVYKTLVGAGIKIDIENCQHGTDACFIFDQRNMEQL
jgi:hypothetical protein